MSHDFGVALRQNVLMTEDDEKIAETEWRRAFQARLKRIQGNRTADQMGDLLGMSRSSWSKVVGARMDQISIRILPKLAALGEMTVLELIEGPKAKPVAAPKRQKKRAAA